jgi:nicotinate-nucleotide adenylyltransferase
VVRRVGASKPSLASLRDLVDQDRLDYFRQFQVEMPLIQLTSTDLRQRIRQGQSIRYRTPRAVEKYIETHRLYLDASQGFKESEEGRDENTLHE